MEIVFIAVGASVIGGYLIRRAVETQPWRPIVQLMLAIGATVYAFINSGAVWAIAVCITVLILQGLFMALFRFIGMKRLAKDMGIKLDHRNDTN